jgi:hypothetical protein
LGVVVVVYKKRQKEREREKKKYFNLITINGSGKKNR